MVIGRAGRGKGIFEGAVGLYTTVVINVCGMQGGVVCCCLEGGGIGGAAHGGTGTVGRWAARDLRRPRYKGLLPVLAG